MKNLLEQIINDRGQHAEKFKEKIAFEVLFEGRDTKELVEEYQLASIYTVNMLVEQYRNRVKEGLITLPAMTEQEKENLQALKKRVKELEKSLEQANVLIYGTYICVGNDFNYPYLITDAYSHKIVGYCLHSLLTNDGALLALDMALKSRTKFLPALIHHSDSGKLRDEFCEGKSFPYFNTNLITLYETFTSRYVGYPLLVVYHLLLMLHSGRTFLYHPCFLLE